MTEDSINRLKDKLAVLKAMGWDRSYTFSELLEKIGGGDRAHRMLTDILRRLEAQGKIWKSESCGCTTYDRGFPDKDIEELEATIKREEVLNVIQKLEPIEDVTNQYNTEFEIEDNGEGAEKITGDKKNLTEYLKKISKLECNIYELQERYKFLADKYIEIAVQEGPPTKREQGIFKTSLVEPKCPVRTFTEPKEPVLQKPGLFNKKKVAEENERLTNEYQTRLNEYNLKLNEYNEKVKQFEEEKANYKEEIIKEKEAFEESERQAEIDWKNAYNKRIQAVQSPVLKEVEILKEGLAKTIKTLKELYAAGIIYSKYRYNVAISTFCDYLMSGRCSELEGPNGAYNLYEAETRADIVICELGLALVSLEKIQKNQYYLYEQLEKANRSLDTINNQLLLSNAIGLAQLDTLGSINTNIKVSAFYSKKNAELTDALGYMTAMR